MIFDQALEVWRCNTFQGFEGQHQCFVFCAGSDRKPVEGAEEGVTCENFGCFGSNTLNSNTLSTSLAPNPGQSNIVGAEHSHILHPISGIISLQLPEILTLLSLNLG